MTAGTRPVSKRPSAVETAVGVRTPSSLPREEEGLLRFRYPSFSRDRENSFGKGAFVWILVRGLEARWRRLPKQVALGEMLESV